jgi:small-conductance mechanosensitive channel/CRP-like cAMP-binding protein
MTSGFVPVVVLAILAAISSLILRRLSTRLRFAFDVLCFAAISAYFESIATFPLFPALGDQFDTGAVAIRVVAGAWWLLGAHIAIDLLWFVFHRDRRSRQARLLFDLSSAAIYITTVMVVLNSVFAVPVTGVVATSGVVAIVIGLALQNTLADVFAGIAVGIEGPFRVGDRVQLGDRIEGDIVQVNWRSIRIQTDGNDVAIIPNSVVAKAEIINRSFPNPLRVASTELPCPRSAPPERVIELLMQATLLCSDVLRTPAPEASLVQLGPKRNLYRVTFHVADTKKLSSTRDLLLRSARRQLHYAGLLDDSRSAAAARAQPSRRAIAPGRLLRDLILLESLTDEQIDVLAGCLETQWLEAKERLFVEGDNDASLYVVASGILELTRQVDGTCETLGCIGSGEHIGEIGLLTATAHAATATARTHCLIYRLAQDQLSPLLADNAELSASFDQSIRRHLEVLHRDVATGRTPENTTSGQLLAQIRSILHLRS